MYHPVRRWWILAALLGALPLSAAAQTSGTTGEALLTQAGAQAAPAAAGVDLLEALGLARAFPGRLGARGPLDRQLGMLAEGNTAVIEQVGTGNWARITQEGSRNVAAVYEDGSFNRLDAAQLGTGNLLGVSLVGSDNTLSVAQAGSNNVYIFDFTGSNLQHSVSQVGNDLRAVQVGVGGIPFSIQQRGNGAEVIIQHNPIVPVGRTIK